jgi:hypothetical protein
MVDIEVEEFYSTTSEEEIEIVTPYTLNKKKSMTGNMSPSGSAADLHSRPLQSQRTTKKTDHLKIFEKRMTQKMNFNSSMKTKLNLSGVKSVRGEKNTWQKSSFGQTLGK